MDIYTKVQITKQNAKTALIQWGGGSQSPIFPAFPLLIK